MAKTKSDLENVVKQADATRQPQKVPFAAIMLDHVRYRHRGDDDTSLSKESIQLLHDSIVKEGMSVPIEVVLHSDGKHFVLVSGHRRYLALRMAIDKKTDTTRFFEEMEVDVIVLTVAAGASEKDREKTVWIASLSSNSNSAPIPDAHKLLAIKTGEDMGVTQHRVYTGLGMSESQYLRFLKITKQPWLVDMVTKQEIATTHAATLIDKAAEKKRVSDLQKHLVGFVKDTRREIDAKAAKKDAAGKPMSKSERLVKKYLSGKQVAHWVKCMDGGQPIDDKFGVKLGLDIDFEKRVCGCKGFPDESFNNMVPEDVDAMFDAWEERVPSLVALRKELERKIEAAGDAEVEDYKAASRARLAKKAEEEAARKVEEDEPEIPATISVGDEINATLDASDDESDEGTED
jgi:hypothetical protein